MNRLSESNPAHQRGVTLLELLMGVAVMAIMVTIAVPSYQDLSERLAVRDGAFQLLEVFHQARSEALKRDPETVSLKFIQQNDALWCARVTTTPASCNRCDDLWGCDLDANTNSGSLEDLLNGSSERGILVGLDNKRMADVGLALGPSYSGGVVTLPNGRTGMTGGFARVSVGDEATACLVVSALGQPELCVPAGRPGIMGLALCEVNCL